MRTTTTRATSPAQIPLISGLLCTLLMAFAIALASAAPLHADSEVAAQQAPNSRVMVNVPASFAPAKLFSGFQDDARGISIVILEAPGEAYQQMADGFTAENLAKRGVKGARKDKLNRADTHIYMRGVQAVPAGTYEKFFVLFKTKDQAILVSANVPATELTKNASLQAEIEGILTSARTVEKRNVKDLYKLTNLGPFKEAGTLVGTSKVFTPDGKLQPEEPATPRSVFIVAPSIDKRPIPDAESYARRLLGSLDGYSKLQVKPAEEITIDGMKGVRFTAEAENTNNGKTVLLHQTFLIAAGGGYYRMLGIAPQAEAETRLAQFNTMSDSLRLIPQE